MRWIFEVIGCLTGSTENAGLENEGQKWNSGIKYGDRKMQDNFAALENARQKLEDPEMNRKQVS